MIVGNVAHPRRVEARTLLENGLPALNIKRRIVNNGDDEAVLGEIEGTDGEILFLSQKYRIGF